MQIIQWVDSQEWLLSELSKSKDVSTMSPAFSSPGEPALSAGTGTPFSTATATILVAHSTVKSHDLA